MLSMHPSTREIVRQQNFRNHEAFALTRWHTMADGEMYYVQNRTEWPPAMIIQTDVRLTFQCMGIFRKCRDIVGITYTPIVYG